MEQTKQEELDKVYEVLMPHIMQEMNEALYFINMLSDETIDNVK